MFKAFATALRSNQSSQARNQVLIKTVIAVGLCTLTATASANRLAADVCHGSPGQTVPWISTTAESPALMHARSSLLSAFTHGLNPTDYSADQLDAQAERLIKTMSQWQDHEQTDSLELEINAFNRQMTGAMTCYLNDVKLGALDPKSLHSDIDIPTRSWTAQKALQTAWNEESIISLLQTAYPRDAQYQQLRIALAAYRKLAENERTNRHYDLKASKILRPEDRDMAINALRNRLVFLGDLTDTERRTAEENDLREIMGTEPGQEAIAPILAPIFDELTVTAVRRFQARHGLTDDGVVGRQTVNALNTPVYERVAQIEMAMERMRWLPDMGSATVVRVNLPEFSLTASNNQASATTETLKSRVVIGRSGKYPTPMYVGQLKRIEFSPYWNVPQSISQREIVPKIRRDLGKMARMNMEIVNGKGKIFRHASPALLNQVVSGEARLRQRPGKKNALGRFKFVLPNARGIFLHDTVSKSLFNRVKRDFSHGCIRVEQPMNLARAVLKDSPRWTEARIQRAAKSKRPVVATPAKPVMVVFTYQTAAVNDMGQMVFLPDIYKYDRRTVASVERWASLNFENVNATARNSAEGQKLASLNL